MSVKSTTLAASFVAAKASQTPSTGEAVNRQNLAARLNAAIVNAVKNSNSFDASNQTLTLSLEQLESCFPADDLGHLKVNASVVRSEIEACLPEGWAVQECVPYELPQKGPLPRLLLPYARVTLKVDASVADADPMTLSEAKALLANIESESKRLHPTAFGEPRGVYQQDIGALIDQWISKKQPFRTISKKVSFLKFIDFRNAAVIEYRDTQPRGANLIDKQVRGKQVMQAAKEAVEFRGYELLGLANGGSPLLQNSEYEFIFRQATPKTGLGGLLSRLFAQKPVPMEEEYFLNPIPSPARLESTQKK